MGHRETWTVRILPSAKHIFLVFLVMIVWIGSIRIYTLLRSDIIKGHWTPQSSGYTASSSKSPEFISGPRFWLAFLRFLWFFSVSVTKFHDNTPDMEGPSKRRLFVLFISSFSWKLRSLQNINFPIDASVNGGMGFIDIDGV